MNRSTFACQVAWFILLVTYASAQVYQLADLNTGQIRALDRGKTVVIIPGGILEEHGPYLPSYTDGFSDQAYSRELANAVVGRAGWTVVMFPQIPLGNGPANGIGGKSIFPGSYPVRMSTLRAVYMDLASELGEQGFGWIFVVHFHDGPGNHLALEQASDYFHEVFGGTMVHLYDLQPVHECCDSGLKMLSAEQRSENGFTVHAGVGEHSEILFLRPDLVSPAIHNAPSITGKDFPDLEKIARREEWPGYFGAPRYASAALGAVDFRAMSEKLNALALQILDGLDWRRLPKFIDEQMAFIRASVQPEASPEDRGLQQRQLQWLKSKNLK